MRGRRPPAAGGDAPYRQGLDRAFRLLAVRARSESELRSRLAGAGFAPEVVDAIVSRLRELGYVDDLAFAAAYVRSRSLGRRVGRRLLRHELVQKGVSAAVIEQTLAARSDQAERTDAAQLAQNLARRGIDDSPEAWAKRKRRIYATLVRRGFAPETAAAVVGELRR